MKPGDQLAWSCPHCGQVNTFRVRMVEIVNRGTASSCPACLTQVQVRLFDGTAQAVRLDYVRENQRARDTNPSELDGDEEDLIREATRQWQGEEGQEG